MANGVATQIANIYGTITVGDVFKFSCVGALFILEKNGGLYWEIVNYVKGSGGAPGICGSPSGASIAAITTWSAGSFTYTPQTPGFILTPWAVSLSGITSNTWKTVTVTVDATGANGPPSSATGLILNFVYTGAGSTVVTRATGSTDTQVPPTANALATNTQGTIFTGVSMTGGPPATTASFDILMSTVGGMTVNVVGYFGTEATFYTNAHPITVPTGDLSTTPGTIDLSATVTTGAVAVFGDLWGNACRITPHGDADILNWLPTGLCQKSFISGTANGVIDITAASGTTPTFYLRGYMTRGFAWRTPAYDVSPASAGSWQNVAAAPTYPAGTRSGMVYQARNASTNFTLASPYNVSTGYNPQKPPVNTTTLMLAGAPSQGPQIYVATTPFTLAEQGYFISLPVPTTGAPTTIRSMFAIRTTSQT